MSVCLSVWFPKRYHSSQSAGCIKAWYIRRKVAGRTGCLTRFMAPIPEAIFLVSFINMVIPAEFVINCYAK